VKFTGRLLKNGHLRRYPVPFGDDGKKSLLIRRDATLRISGALRLALFEQPGKDDFFGSLLV